MYFLFLPFNLFILLNCYLCFFSFNRVYYLLSTCFVYVYVFFLIWRNRLLLYVKVKFVELAILCAIVRDSSLTCGADDLALSVIIIHLHSNFFFNYVIGILNCQSIINQDFLPNRQKPIMDIQIRGLRIATTVKR